MGNSLISRWQSGFLPGFSTVLQLLEMYHQFYNAFNEGKDVRIVYLDISKAFDQVWHKGLLFKLNKFGFGGKLLKWFSDYLSNRYQRVIINGKCSDWLKVTAGFLKALCWVRCFFLYLSMILPRLSSTVTLDYLPITPVFS